MKKLTAVLLASATALLTACGPSDNAPAASAQAPAAAKKVVVGLDDNFPPMGFRDANNQIVGFDIDMAKEASKRLGLEVEFKPIDWSAKEAELNGKRVDVLWNGLTITEERKKNISFTAPYMANHQIIIVGSASPIKTKADLAGKVVIIDFWATWCGPCLVELPEIQKLVDELEKDKKNVLVVALSQDNEPAELAEVRGLVEKTLKEKELNLVGKTASAVGLDPSNAVGEKFQVEGLPTLVVLDGEGVIRSAHIGFSPDIREKLTAEIDALLAGKPLPAPGAEEKE